MKKQALIEQIIKRSNFMMTFERKRIKQVIPSALPILVALLLAIAPAAINAQSPAAPRYWLAPISNVRVSGGTPAGSSILSVGADGNYADLYKMDDKSGRQR